MSLLPRLAPFLFVPLLTFAQSSPISDLPAAKVVLAWAEKNEPRTLEEQVKICEIPAPTFAEKIRGEYVRKRFVELGLKDVRVDAVGNVLGTRPGRSDGPVVVFSAHLDTVFPEGTDTRVKHEGTLLKAPGIADNCRGLAVMLTAVEALQENKVQTESTVVFVATVGEEGLGDLIGVRTLFTKTMEGKISHFIALDGTGLGTTSGAVGSNRYRVTFHSAGGHSYGMFGLVNPIHALGRAIAKISQFEVPDSPKTTFNVGRIDGGTSVNSIAHDAWMEIDMRSVSAEELAKVDAAFKRAVEEAVAEENAFWSTRAKSPVARMTNTNNPVTAKIELVGQRPTGRTDDKAPILEAVRRADAALGVTSKFDAGSTDSNIPISMGIPAVTLRTGGDGTGNHALQEQFDTKDSYRGTQRALLVLMDVAGALPWSPNDKKN